MERPVGEAPAGPNTRAGASDATRVQVLADPAGRLISSSPALPGAIRHIRVCDWGATRLPANPVFAPTRRPTIAG